MRRFVVAVAFVLGLAGGVRELRAEPPHSHEILYNRPSGFWTSNRPAVGGAYRYRLMGIGGVIAIGMGYLIWRLLKRANDDRNNRR